MSSMIRQDPQPNNDEWLHKVHFIKSFSWKNLSNFQQKSIWKFLVNGTVKSFIFGTACKLLHNFVNVAVLFANVNTRKKRKMKGKKTFA